METKLTIGERLKDLRVERDMNQKDVENQAGIPTSTLSTYENDTVGNVNVAAIIKLAEFYDVFGGMVKSCVFGAIIAIVGCYKGLNAPNGAEGVGLATTASVVLSIILIFITNYFLSIILYV